MWITINKYCEIKNITRSTFYYRVKVGHIPKKRLKMDDGKPLVWVKEVGNK